MSIVKKVGIDGKEVLFKASAAIPRIYRLKFQRDIYKDLRILEKSIGEGDEEHSNLDLFSLEMFENIALIRGCCGRGLRGSGCLEKGGLRWFGRLGICSAGEIRKNW